MGKLEHFEDGTRPPCWYPFWNGRSWCYDFRVEGIRYRASTGVRDPEAIEIAITVAKGVHDAAWARALSPYPTFQEAGDLYVGRFGKHAKEVEELIEYFGPDIRVDEIMPFMIDQAMVDLSRPTWHTDQTARRQVFMPTNAVINFALGKRPRQWAHSGREPVLDPEEAERLIRVAQEPAKANLRDPERRLLKLIAFELGTGAAPGETHVIRAEDCNWPTRQVWVRGVQKGARKTKYRRRWVHVPDRSLELMDPLPEDGLVFLTPTGRPIITDGEHGTHLIKQFHKLCHAAGLRDAEEIVFYTLRHTWATWFSAQVGDLALLIERGGWSDAEMAMHYRKQAPADLGERLLAHGWDFRP
ncbi:tyrosine-type recombinase/integrase [Lacimonas salitolerans]|uniref:Tyrosine-type recombinase/integrase n=1 Tax=Lacimonas salitolerans TaxID=1323750 RepID=A0ABW4EG66_9RHOB